jgi:DNA polymerase bacteriophage-type
MTDPILLDVEAQSRCDLRAEGGRRYWEHPSTRALCVVLHDTRTGERSLWLEGDPAPNLEGRELGAHGWSNFDRFACVRLGWCGLDYATGVDTSELARAAGLPGALDALGTRWLGTPKDKESSAFVVLLSTCRRPSGKKNPNAITPEVWRTFTEAEKRERGVQKSPTADDLVRTATYCDSDVDIMSHGWPLLEPYLGFEPDVRAVDRIVNDRGVGFDVQLARRLLEEDARNAEIECARAAKALGAGWTPALVREVAGSPEQFAEVTGLPDARKATLDEYALDTCAEWVPLVMARRALASIARGKLEAGLARTSPDGRLRDSHRYIGAHPWRWAGRGVQLQNIPRPEKRFEEWGDDEICAAADAVLAGAHADPGLIDVLLRACLVAKPGHTFAVCDYSGVESRALAWIADDRDAIDVILSGRDAYKAEAVNVYGVPYEQIVKHMRQVGKVAVLALGYQGARGAFANMAKQAGLSLEGIDVDGVVAAWRRAHAPTVRFWYDLERAFIRAAHGSEARVGVGCELVLTPSDDGQDVAIWLPTGRPIVYNAVRLRRDERGRVKVSYSPMTPGPGTYMVDGELRADTYGGKLTQNVIEGICRELLARSLVAAERAGLAPCVHVHDEIVGEVPRTKKGTEGLDHLRRIMLDLDDWAEGFPIGAAGHEGRRYRK